MGLLVVIVAAMAQAQPNSPEGPKADVAALKAVIRHLRAENARLRHENEQLKQQVASQAPADQVDDAPADAEPLTPAQMAQQRREQAQAARLQRQIEHWRREEKKAQKEYDAVQNWGLDSTIKRKYVTRNGRRYYREAYGPNGPGPDMARAKDALDKAKARLAELEAKQAEAQQEK